MSAHPSPFNSEGVQYAWDATSISLAETCLRKYQYTVLEGWQSRSMSEHLRFGAAYATALEHYFKYEAEGATPDEALMRVVHEALIETWDYEWIEISDDEALADMVVYGQSLTMVDEEGKRYKRGGGKPWQSTHNTKNRENLIRSIVWYFAHFKDDPMPVITLSNGKPAVELSFTLEVENGLLFSGHIDRLVEYGGHKYIMDQKTTGSTIGAYYWDQFKPHTQFSMYTFAGKAIYDIPIKGVIVDAAQIAVGFTNYARQPIMFTQPELDEFYRDALYWIERAQTATAKNYFPMNRSACGNYGGCAFRHVCSRSPEVRPQFLLADFDKGEGWNPLARR